MELAEPPKTEHLKAELADCVRSGITVKALLRCTHILRLSVVQAKASTDDPQDRAVAARDLLSQLAIQVDGERNGPSATLLGLATGSRGSLLKERRELVAQMLHISAAHLRTSNREDQLVEALADELYAADSAFRLRHRHRTEPERLPAENRLGVDWLDRHQAYRRVWTPVYAMRDDVPVLLKFLREDKEPSDIVDRLMTITWRWAQFQIQLDNFISDYGGLWLLADVESEFACADAVQRIEFLTMLGEADESWLRRTIRQAHDGELEPFSELVADSEAGETILGAWLAWAKSCDCPPRLPEPERCVVHGWIAAVDQFTELLSQDWIAVADWYRLDVDNAAASDAASRLVQRKTP